MTPGTQQDAAPPIGNEPLTTMERILHHLRMDRCPVCEKQALVAGPRGGANQNLHCTSCGARWNVAPPRYIMFAERIG